jgi:hypothetical protein
MTAPARAASAAVSTPVPAPISTTRSSGSTRARCASSDASRRGRKCCPSAGAPLREARDPRASTEDRHEDAHVRHSVGSSENNVYLQI